MREDEERVWIKLNRILKEDGKEDMLHEASTQLAAKDRRIDELEAEVARRQGGNSTAWAELRSRNTLMEEVVEKARAVCGDGDWLKVRDFQDLRQSLAKLDEESGEVKP